LTALMIPGCFQNKTARNKPYLFFFYVQIVSLADDLRRKFFRNLQKREDFYL